MKRSSPGVLYRRLIAVAAFSLTAAVIPPATAAITSMVIDNLDGTYTYSYSVDNTGGTFSIASWSLDLGILPDWNQNDVPAGGDVDVPSGTPGWIARAGIAVSGTAAQDFLSLGPGGDVLAGQILGGFSFISAFPPGATDYYEFSSSGDTRQGTVAAPIPEPAALSAVLAAGLAGWMVLRHGRRGR